MVPDVHNLKNYPFTSVHEQMKNMVDDVAIASSTCIQQLAGLEPAQIYSMPGDPHPNARGHGRMAEASTLF